MTPLEPAGFHPPQIPHRAILGQLDAFLIALNRDREDRSVFVTQLRRWQQTFREDILKNRDPSSETLQTLTTHHLNVLSTQIAIPIEPHRMLEPICDLLKYHRMPIPDPLLAPAKARRLARLQLLKQTEQKTKDLAEGIRTDFAPLLQIEELDSLKTRAQLLTQKIETTLLDTQKLEEDQLQVTSDLTRAKSNIDSLKTAIDSCEQARQEKQASSASGVALAVIGAVACAAITGGLGGAGYVAPMNQGAQAGIILPI